MNTAASRAPGPEIHHKTKRLNLVTVYAYKRFGLQASVAIVKIPTTINQQNNF